VRIILTGSNGFIGKKLLNRILDDKHDVAVILRSSSCTIDKRNHANDQIVIHRFKSQSKLNNFFSKFEPDVVVHLAGTYVTNHKNSDIKKMIDDNVIFGNRILEALTHVKKKNFINTGTSWQHYESVEYNPVNIYAATKQAFQDILVYYAEAFDFRIITLKLFDTYGPSDHRKKIINLILNQIKSEQPIELTPGNQLMDLVHVDDVVEAYMVAIDLIVKNSEEKITEYGVSAEETITIKALAELIQKLSRKNLNIIFGGVNYRNREVFTPWKSFNLLPGWKPKIELDAGLKEMLNDYLQELK
jgi:CDP-3, 6-dideoxy-D-glycero-L-glycero-4-hexulose-4-reductase